MRVFGIDPGSERTGYGCVETDGSRHRIVVCGAIRSPALASFPDKLLRIHSQLSEILADCRPVKRRQWCRTMGQPVPDRIDPARRNDD